MMRWLLRLAFPALGLLVALMVFGIRAPESPTRKPEETRLAGSIPSFEALVPAPVKPTGPDIVFKWQDADGNWNYADHPPDSGNWNTLAIEPGQGARTLTPLSPGTSGDDLNAPYSAPFDLDPSRSRAGS